MSNNTSLKNLNRNKPLKAFDSPTNTSNYDPDNITIKIKGVNNNKDDFKRDDNNPVK